MNSSVGPICFMNTNPVWGGGERFVLEYARRCRDAGIETHVLAAPGSDLAMRIADEDGIGLHQRKLGNLAFANPLKLLWLRKLFRGLGIRSLVMALPSDLKAGGLAARWAGLERIAYRRGIAVEVRDTRLNRFLYGKAIHRLIVNSRETLRCVLANNSDLVAQDKVRLVYNGFDLDGFLDKASAPLIERRNREVLIGCSARLTRQKGQAHLLRAVAALRKQGFDLRLLLAGKGEDEDMLKVLARQLEITDCVEFLGFVEDLAGFYASLDIFCLPSLWEGFGYSLVEAMAFCLPVAAFNVSSIPEVVVHQETGLLCPPGDHQALARNLAALAGDHILRDRLGRAGQDRVRGEFSQDKTFQDFLDALE